jgi:ribulose-5-phosphate 4-epimerase/fuculose-1-phosphate aldolase
VVFDEFNGVVLDLDEGRQIAEKLGQKKAAILQNHGLLTVGNTVDEAAWWYITMERTCQAQLMAEAAGKPILISDEVARKTHANVGSPVAGVFSFKPLYEVITTEQPDLFN